MLRATYSYNAITGTPALGAGRLSGLTVPIFGTGKTAALTYAYDALGRVVARGIDQATTNANNVATTFDTLGRVTNVSNALGAFVYAYVNATSRLSGVTYPTGTGLSTAYSYFSSSDSQDFERLQGIQNLKGSTQLSDYQYTYNPVGTIAKWTQQSDSSTAVVNTLSYDGADQLTGDAQSGGATTAYGYAYDPSGNRLTGSVGSTTTVGQFNNLNQLKETTTGATSTTVAGHTSAAVSSLNVNAVPATIAGSTNFTANVPLPSGTNIFSVVARPTSGSIATQKYQIVTTGSAPTVLSYDKNGNVLTDENGNKYQWDALNRLTKITYPVAVGGNSTFAYDGLSRRVQIVDTTSGGIVTTKNYLWIGSEIAEERNTSNAVTKRFFPQGEQQAGTNYYYTRDHLGSTREVCNSSGTILTRYTYDPYGRTTTNHLSGSVDATFQFARLYAHQTSGLDLPVYRGGYDPNTGRWMQRDWAGERGGLNLYGYVGEDPIANLDPLGLASVTPGPHQTVSVQMENCEVVLVTGHGADWAVNKFIPPSTPGCGALAGQDTCDNGPSNNNIPPANQMGGLGTYDEASSADMARRMQTYAAIEAAIAKLCPCCKKVKFTVVWINKYGYETRTWGDWWGGQGSGTSSIMIDCKQPLKPQILNQTW